MAFAFVQAQTGSSTAGTGTYTTSAFGSSATVGNTIIAIVTSDGNTASQVTSLTDSKGNTWTKDAETVDVAQATKRYVSVWRAPITTGGTGLTVTVNYDSASSNNSGICFQEWSSASAFTKDQTAGGGSTTGTTSPTTSTTGATTVASELVVGGFVSNSTQASFTAGAGYSNASFVAVSNASACMESKTVAATGTQVATGTFGTSRAYGAIIITYSEGSAPPASNSNFLFFLK